MSDALSTETSSFAFLYCSCRSSSIVCRILAWAIRLFSFSRLSIPSNHRAEFVIRSCVFCSLSTTASTSLAGTVADCPLFVNK